MEQQTIEPRRMTIDEYLQFERESDQRHEYHSGEVVAMAGGLAMHSLIAINIAAAIKSRLGKKPCRVFSSDLRVRIPNHPTYVYPDLTVVCGPLEYDERDRARHTITNPRLVIEVLSPSSAARDWVQKTGRYVSVPSLTEYLLVSQLDPEVFSIYRSPDATWSFTPSIGLDKVMKLRSLEIEIPLGEVFAGVEFPLPPESDDASAPR